MTLKSEEHKYFMVVKGAFAMTLLRKNPKMVPIFSAYKRLINKCDNSFGQNCWQLQPAATLKRSIFEADV